MALSTDPVKYQTLNPKRFASNLNEIRKISNNSILNPPKEKTERNSIG
jgi:hypothetical protein